MNKSVLQRTANLFMNIHYFIQKSPGASLYENTFLRIKKLREILSFTLWKIFRSRPFLNTDSTSRIISNYGFKNRDYHPASEPTPLLIGRLKVNIAFHLKPTRLKYLLETLKQIRNLPFEEISIVVDTNSTETIDLLRYYDNEAADGVIVHEDLDHPFKLTWAHRAQMSAAFSDFNYFMYIEDDMIVTTESIKLWSHFLPVLSSNGYLPGFLRVEENRNGKLVASDFMNKALPSDIVYVDGSPYLLTPFPYQAFWIYDKSTMAKFMGSKAFLLGDIPYVEGRIRENAALGYASHPMWNSFSPKHLLPLNSDLQIDPRCFAFHMPSNYGRLIIPHSGNLGTIPVEQLIDHGPVRVYK